MKRGTLAIAFLTLTLAIAAATTTFSVVDAVALRRLPFPDDDRLVSIARVSVTNPQPAVVAPQDYFAWRDRTTTFASLGATGAWTASRLAASNASEALMTRRVTANFFDVLGVPPMIGRGFTANEDTQGARSSLSSATASGQRTSAATRACWGRPCWSGVRSGRSLV